MHLGILALVDFADLTLGMLVAHAFTFDPAWVRTRVRGAAPARGAGVRFELEFTSRPRGRW